MSGQNPSNRELLRLAADLANAGYSNRRANVHNQWLADNDKMLKMGMAAIPYPAIPTYPTDDEVIAIANKLVEFLTTPRPDLEVQQPPQPDFIDEEIKPLTIFEKIKQMVTRSKGE